MQKSQNIVTFKSETGTIHPKVENGKGVCLSHGVVFTDLSVCPIDLEPGKVYIISSWESNHYIKAGEANSFEVFDHYGADLDKEHEYLIFEPKY